MHEKVDSVTLEVIHHRLTSIADEMEIPIQEVADALFFELNQLKVRDA